MDVSGNNVHFDDPFGPIRKFALLRRVAALSNKGKCDISREYYASGDRD